MSETRDVKLRRLHMRSIRRGIKEMDLILSDFSNRHLAKLSDDELALYDDLLQENDQELYGWLTGVGEASDKYQEIWPRIVETAEGLVQQK